MANKVYSDFSDISPLDGNEIIPCIDDPSGTPANGRFTPADIATYLGSGTVMNGLILTWDAVDGITVETGQCYTESGDNVAATSAIAKASLSLSSSTWYHVYVYLSTGTPAAEVVTTAPVAWTGTAYSKTGDTSRRYVGSILTDGSSNIYPFEHSSGSNYIAYKLFNSGAGDHRVLNGGTATTATAVDFSGVIPTTSRLINVRLVSTADQVVDTSEDNSVSSTQYTVVLTAGDTVTQITVTPHSMDSSQQVWYKFRSAVGGGAFYMDCMGYYFDR